MHDLGCQNTKTEKKGKRHNQKIIKKGNYNAMNGYLGNGLKGDWNYLLNKLLIPPFTIYLHVKYPPYWLYDI